jgi:uncharacterized membrane protein YcaP (DUF421 family)
MLRGPNEIKYAHLLHASRVAWRPRVCPDRCCQRMVRTVENTGCSWAAIAYAHAMHAILDHMFRLPLPILEKLVRPVCVYLVLVLLVRLFGKRELAQLNPFDLIVLLSLSNTVQNAIIGDDNSVTGGIIGAFGLLAVNWLVVRTLFRSPKLTRMLQGKSTVLVRRGKVDEKALDHESMSHEELIEVIHRQGFEHLNQIARCELEPNGTFYIEAAEPSPTEHQHQQLMAKLETMSTEIAGLRARLSGEA